MLRGCWRLSDDLDVSRWSGLWVTCLQEVMRVVLVEFGERHDKRAALHRRRPPADQSDNENYMSTETSWVRGVARG